MRKLTSRKIYNSNRNLYSQFSFPSLELTCHESRSHHSKNEFKYAKYSKSPQVIVGLDHYHILLYSIYWWQKTEKAEKWKCQPNKRRTCSQWLHSHLIFRCSEAQQQASMHLRLEAVATTHIYKLWKGQNAQSALFSTKNS